MPTAAIPAADELCVHHISGAINQMWFGSRRVSEQESDPEISREGGGEGVADRRGSPWLEAPSKLNPGSTLFPKPNSGIILI